LAIGVARGRHRLVPIVLAHAVAAAIVAAYYGLEQLATSGMFLRSAFAVPAELKAVTGGSWGFVALVATTTAKRAVGLIGLGAACALGASRRSAAGRLDGLLVALIALELALMVKLCLDSSGGWYNYALQSAVLGAVLLGRSMDRIVSAEGTAW